MVCSSSASNVFALGDNVAVLGDAGYEVVVVKAVNQVNAINGAL